MPVLLLGDPAYPIKKWLRNLRLYADAERVGTPFANSGSVCICNVEVPVLLLGDPAYPIKKWLLKPYPESKNSTQSERDFNYKNGCARILVERAFGLLKGRWRILLSPQEGHLNNIQAVAVASCTVHNYCLLHKEIDFDYEVESSREGCIEVGLGRGTAASASFIRNTIRDYLATL